MQLSFKSAGRLSLAAIFIATSSSCQSDAVLPNRVDPQKLDSIETVRLDVQMKSSEFNVDFHADQLDLDVPVAAVTTAQVAAMNTDRETAAAAGIIGTFIGVQLAQHAHKAKLQNAANDPVTGLKRRLEAGGFHRHVGKMFRQELEQHLSGRYLFTESNFPPHAVLDVALEVSLVPDLSSIHLRAEAAMRTLSSGVPVYAREIDFHDTPVGNPSVLDPSALAQKWTENDGEVFWTRLEASVNALAALLTADMERGVFQGASGGHSIRYRNQRGLFYERGHLLEDSGNRLLIRTLRGGLVSVPGNLVVNASRAASP